ncbi:hypothetical protein B0T10DRAFT_476207 [Thelonectria olida]|uniref:WW domain-containing protein n=1 Tax=Thelonectria olida TaxID=1576542 RepID=A0A9P9AXE1_9HYPO|nr:hypothetical protein B0T10DRAFT_476207 [Thelonectria olida]
MPSSTKAQSPPPTDLPEASTRDVPVETTKEETAIPNSEASDDPKPDAPNADEKAPASADAPPLPSEPAPVSDGPPLPNEPTPDDPPLPNEPVPEPKDDGWDCQWDATHQAWYFLNRFTGKTQWDNPRVPTTAATAASATTAVPQPPAVEQPGVGGYNPAIHGDYDPNAWYAKGNDDDAEASTSVTALNPADVYASTASFNRFTGQFQTDDMGPNRHNDEAKSKRQMNAYFDVDAAANSHDGRSLKAERSGKKPSKAEVKAFKEKRRARKEEKRRAWLRD